MVAEQIFTPSGFTKTPIVGAVLDIGCGGRKLSGSVGVDSLALAGVDVVHNLNVFPWPFADNSFDVVFANHYLEHADSVVATLNEVHRILKHRGTFVCQVPFFKYIDAYGDPTHTRYFTSRSLNYAIVNTEERKYRYTDNVFQLNAFWYGWPNASKLKKILTYNKDLYDQYLSIIRPFPCLTWELVVVK